MLVGVTGGLASGKSAVCRILAEMGCVLFEADKVAKELQLTDAGVIEGMKRLFGEDIYTADEKTGALRLDRQRVARAIFNDTDARKAINELLHPKVFKAFHDSREQAVRDGVRILVKEAAILLESGGEKGLDLIVVVVADLETRIKRAMKKGMGNREEIESRIRAQWPQEKLVEKADYVIENNGTFEELEQATQELYQKILATQDS